MGHGAPEKCTVAVHPVPPLFRPASWTPGRTGLDRTNRGVKKTSNDTMASFGFAGAEPPSDRFPARQTMKAAGTIIPATRKPPRFGLFSTPRCIRLRSDAVHASPVAHTKPADGAAGVTSPGSSYPNANSPNGPANDRNANPYRSLRSPSQLRNRRRIQLGLPWPGQTE